MQPKQLLPILALCPVAEYLGRQIPLRAEPYLRGTVWLS